MPVLLCVCVLCNRQIFATKCAVETHQISMLFLQLVSEALNFPKKSDNLGLKVPSQLSNYCQISKNNKYTFQMWNPLWGFHVCEQCYDCPWAAVVSFYLSFDFHSTPEADLGYAHTSASILQVTVCTPQLWHRFHHHGIQVKTFISATVTLSLDSDSHCTVTKSQNMM